MINESVDQLRQACINANTTILDKICNNVKSESIEHNDLLQMVCDCIKHGYFSNAISLFFQAVQHNNNVYSALVLWFKLPELNQQIQVKKNLLDIAVSEQRSYAVLLNYALLYRDIEEFYSAEKLLHQLIEQNPGDVRAFNRLISVYLRMTRYHDAIACCQLALEIDSNGLTAWYNLGVARQALNQDTDALAAFKKTLDIDPGNKWAHINIAHVLLKQGHFEQGWIQYDARKLFFTEHFNQLGSIYPLWESQNIAGKHILIWADQGLGDIVMFSSLLDRVRETGGRISMLAPIRLKTLFERSFEFEYFFDEQSMDYQCSGYGINFQIPVSGLGKRFIREFSDFSNVTGYLTHDSERESKLKQLLLPSDQKLKVIGFGWRGGVVDTKKYARNIPLQQWSVLFDRKDCLFVNFQYDSTPEENSWVENHGGINLPIDSINDIEGVAAALKVIDLYISMDNSTVHLAGALGIPVWNLLPFSGEWRWFTESEKCYWYPEMRILRQIDEASWTENLLEINEMLSSYIKKVKI